MTALPNVGGDSGAWGAELNAFLLAGHNTDGTTKGAFSGILNAKDYGAKGDGATDDSTAIAAAITAAGSNGLVYLPPGTYALIAAMLTLPTGVKLMGAGERLTTVKRAAALGTVISVTGDNVTIEGFAIDGGLSSFATNANHGVSVQNANHFRARRISSTNYLNTAILIQGSPAATYRDGIIENCTCDGGGAANNGHLIVAMDESGIRNCTARNIPGSPGYGNQLKNGCRYSFIEDCVSVSCSGGNVFGRDSSPGVSHSRMTGVTSISCDGGILLGDATNNVISGAKVHMTTNVNDAIRLQQVSVGNVITGVQVSGVGASRSAVRFDDTSTDNVVTLDSVDCSGANSTAAVANSADRNLVEVKKYVNQPTHELSNSSTGTQNRVRRSDDRLSLKDNTFGAITQSFGRDLPTVANAMVTQIPYYIPVYLRAGEVIANVTFHVSALTVAPTNFYVGLYTAGGVQKAVSTDQAANVTTTGQKTLALSTAYTVLDAGIYYVALLNNGGTLSPLGLASSTASRIGSNPYPYAQDSATQTTLPTPNLSLAAGTKALWVELT